MNEMALIYLTPVIAIIIVCIGWYIIERRTDHTVETEIKRDKERIDKFTDSVKHCTDSVTECESTTERITEIERRAEHKISVASESVAEAKHTGNRIEQLADECLAILEEAEEKSRKS